MTKKQAADFLELTLFWVSKLLKSGELRSLDDNDIKAFKKKKDAEFKLRLERGINFDFIRGKHKW